ncbi:MAG: ribonuclease P protein component [Nocardioides sp.]
MLTREHRLTSGRHFAPALRRGRRAGTRTVVVHLLETDHPDSWVVAPRVGFVVSKSVGNAVLRNRVKRRLRHLVQERLASLPGSSVLVVRALPAAATATYCELGTDLDQALSRTGTRS